MPQLSVPVYKMLVRVRRQLSVLVTISAQSYMFESRREKRNVPERMGTHHQLSQLKSQPLARSVFQNQTC